NISMEKITNNPKNISVGKLRGIQRISNNSDVFNILAIDHRNSLETMINPDSKITEEQYTEAKLDMASILGNSSSAILLDPLYGAGQAISQNIINKNIGLLVGIESSGYDIVKIKDKKTNKNIEARTSSTLTDWNVEKIKRMGADAVKLVIYYRPDLGKITTQQERLVKAVSKDCKKHDIAFLCEIVTYPKDANENNEIYELEKPNLIIKSAENMNKFDIDILKAEFPCDLKTFGEKNAYEYCKKITEASNVPWVLLSRGADIETYKKQLEIACKGGASGFACGRAIWQDAYLKHKGTGQIAYLKKEALNNLMELNAITNKYALPWSKKLGTTEINSIWYKKY
ncbi:MAG: tagatose 1,6-diphosphate aldolase, partial [DPANN group archaeon]|nr:tagatose 1,6-diphosphate aldolase [DPANN group archaeon]